MREGWTSTTHDWDATVDPGHLRSVRDHPHVFAPGGVRHLLHEVLAYVADEVESVENSDACCVVELEPDGALSVRDFGRGTDTRRDENGLVVRKPVMATKDLRFFDHPDAQSLPDGHPRRGMSVVSALSEWLVHENRRTDGAWQQRYRYGLPVDDLMEAAADGSTGTRVSFRALPVLEPLSELDLVGLQNDWPTLRLVGGRDS